MNISGEMIIGQRLVRGMAGFAKAIDPARGTALEPEFGQATVGDVDAACTLAWQAFDTFRDTTPEQRARFLETIAEGIIALGPILIERATQESGLPTARLEGERGRTVNQLRLFAKVVRDGHWLDATIDSALPERAPPRPSLRMRRIALGPVAVFGASNFPLAFSVAGGDTASAFAAGCPVVVKAHGAHPGTSELVARVIQKAAADCALPEGVFSMLSGDGRVVGQALVAHPAIKAVGFTGSRQGGLALVRTAAGRAEPIPVYAEMASINPVFMLPGAIEAGGAALAQGLIDSLTLGVGQFCTNPGLVIGLAGAQFDQFARDAGAGDNRRPGLRRARRAVRLLGGSLSRQPGAGRRDLRTMRADGQLPRRGRNAPRGGACRRPADCHRACHRGRSRTGSLAAADAGAQSGQGAVQRLPDRRRGVACDGPWRPVPGDVGQPQHVGRRYRDRTLPASGVLPEPA